MWDVHNLYRASSYAHESNIGMLSPCSHQGAASGAGTRGLIFTPLCNRGLCSWVPRSS